MINTVRSGYYGLKNKEKPVACFLYAPWYDRAAGPFWHQWFWLPFTEIMPVLARTHRLVLWVPISFKDVAEKTVPNSQNLPDFQVVFFDPEKFTPSVQEAFFRVQNDFGCRTSGTDATLLAMAFRDFWAGENVGPAPDVFFLNAGLKTAIFEKAFPKATFFRMEVGLYSTSFFPFTIFLDNASYGAQNMYNRHASTLRKRQLTSDEQAFLQDLRAPLVEFLDTHMPFKQILAAAKKRFRKLILVVLQDDSANFYGMCRFKSQLDFLESVLRQTPPDVGVVVTEHPWFPKIGSLWEKHFRLNWPNVIWDVSFQKTIGTADFWVRHVDAVVSVSSSVGHQAVFWQKPLMVPSDNSFLCALADATSPGQLKEILASDQTVYSKDPILFWLLTHYWLPHELVKDPEWMGAWIQNAIANAGSLEAYPQTDSLSKLKAFCLSHKPHWAVRELRPGRMASTNFLTGAIQDWLMDYQNLLDNPAAMSLEEPKTNRQVALNMGLRNVLKVFIWAVLLRFRKTILGRILAHLKNHGVLSLIRASVRRL